VFVAGAGSRPGGAAMTSPSARASYRQCAAFGQESEASFRTRLIVHWPDWFGVRAQDLTEDLFVKRRSSAIIGGMVQNCAWPIPTATE